MFHHPNWDPVALDLGFIQIHWYSLAYLAGFACFYYLGKWQIKRGFVFWNDEKLGDFLFLAILSVIAGGRIGYCLFYNFGYYSQNLLEVLFLWQGGMSFHGALIAVIGLSFYYAKKQQISIWVVSDFIAPLVPLGLFFGRLANFINSELWGKVSDVPWAMIAPFGGYEALPRHPSQLYQAFLEGLVLFAITHLVWRKVMYHQSQQNQQKPTKLKSLKLLKQATYPKMGLVTGCFLLFYGIFRFLVEFVRIPDIQLGYLLNTSWLTMGQVLTLPMMLLGGFLMIKALKN